MDGFCVLIDRIVTCRGLAPDVNGSGVFLAEHVKNGTGVVFGTDEVRSQRRRKHNR
jgi:hypothetical protein